MLDPFCGQRGEALGGDAGLIGGVVIVRQHGTKIHAGENCGCGSDYTLFAKVAGTVKFYERKNRKYCSIVAVEAEN